MRVLHVVGNMNRAGAETWLVNVLRRVDPSRVRFDFVVHSDREYALGAEARALGGRLLVCPWPSFPTTYASRFRALIDRWGPYDVVHCHLNHVGTWILWLARSRPVSRRIVHTHTARPAADAPLLARVLERTARRVQSAVTNRVAVSDAAARASFGPDWRALPDSRIVRCGIDLGPFDRAIERAALRRQFGINDHTFVVGHVGRFVPAKNHEFLLGVAAAAVRRAPDVRFLLVGDGPGRQAAERAARRLGLAAHVIFAGVRADVPDLMRGCMDAFVLPSRYEGLGLALIEAQAAGLPSLVADVVPPEASVCPDLVARRPLSASLEEWASVLMGFRSLDGREERQARGRDAVRRSAFNIERSVESLMALYAGLPEPAAP